jgi:DNA/RNA-binding domain of Phe-tRNA-synthetase-like protein
MDASRRVLRHSAALARDTARRVLGVTAETGMPLIALDADRLQGALGLRYGRAGEPLHGGSRHVRARQIVIADADDAIAILFGERSTRHNTSDETRAVALAAIQVRGVPDAAAHDALRTAAEMLSAAA